jgi:hypothetical protein
MMMLEMDPTITVPLPAAVADTPRPSQYPLPLATHEEVRNNKNMFLSTLAKFVAAMGSTLGRCAASHPRNSLTRSNITTTQIYTW